MKKEVTLGQVITIGVTLLITIMTGWITMNNRVSKLEANSASLQRQYERIESKIDRIFDNVTELKSELNNKKNRD